VVLELILIYFTYLIILLLGSYYVNLYLSKDHFTKEELKNVVPFLTQSLKKVMNSHSMSIMIILLFVSSLLGILVTMLSENWFLNSSIIFIVMFLTFPLAKKNFDKVKVTIGGSYADTAINIFSKYYNFLLIGYGNGTASALMYNWGVYKAVPFLWFLINFIVISILLGMVINNIWNQ
jgi:hypothetical protein